MSWEIGGVHCLVTGLNGHGKTLFTVAELLANVPGSTITIGNGPDAKQIPRRLVVGGIKDLLLEHELMDVPAIDPETWKDVSRDLRREPSDPVFEVDGGSPIVRSVVNWWTWCQPGDVIVIDECQRVFRPMASGRRVPMFIEKLETARHYGVQFVYITQHPQLLHTNVRSLVGPHRHVRRVFGGSRTIIYEWDHCTHPDRTKNATVATWKHARRAFGLYASAQAHTKFKVRLPLAGWMLLGLAVLVLPLGYFVSKNLQPIVKPTLMGSKGQPSQGAPKGSSSDLPPHLQKELGAAIAGIGAFAVSPPVPKREPFAGWALHLAGRFVDSLGRPASMFSASMAGKVVSSLTDADVIRAGYSVRYLAPCVVVLIFGDAERLVTCDTPNVSPSIDQAPQRRVVEGGVQEPPKSAPQPVF